MGSSHPAKKRRLLALTSGRPEVASASAVQPSVPPDALLDPAIPIWTIRPSHEQPLSMEFELTHMRPVPLPFAIDLVIEGKRYACMYCGHGQSKVVYRVLTATTTKWVLKLTARMDTEPYVCQKLSAVCGAAQPASKICPAIHGIGRCLEQDECGTPKCKWFGWLADYVTPLDRYIQDPTADREACFKMALYQQVRAAQQGLLLSDNNLMNFGVKGDTVVIIDTGKEPLRRHAISKSDMNTGAIQGWWKMLEWRGSTSVEAARCRAVWRQCCSLEEVARRLCDTRLPPLSTGSALRGVEQPAAAITQAPSVWELLEEQWQLADDDEATDDVSWLVAEFMFGNLAQLKLLRTGETVPLERQTEALKWETPSNRLQTVVQLTQQRRSRWVESPDEILSEENLKGLLAEWKDDWESWMCPSSQLEWHKTEYSKRRTFERSRFRTFLFKMLGSYDLVIFWLRVPASGHSLHIFRKHFEMTAAACCAYPQKEDRMNEAVEAFRQAYGPQ